MVVDVGLTVELLAWPVRPTSGQAVDSSFDRRIESAASVAAFAIELATSFRDDCCRSFGIDV